MSAQILPKVRLENGVLETATIGETVLCNSISIMNNKYALKRYKMFLHTFYLLMCTRLEEKIQITTWRWSVGLCQQVHARTLSFLNNAEYTNVN